MLPVQPLLWSVLCWYKVRGNVQVRGFMFGECRHAGTVCGLAPMCSGSLDLDAGGLDLGPNTYNYKDFQPREGHDVIPDEDTTYPLEISARSQIVDGYLYIWHTGLCFCKFLFIRIYWHATYGLVSSWCQVTMLCLIVMLYSHVIMLHYDIINAAPGTCAEAYKRPHAMSLGVHSSSISQWVRRYTHMHSLMCWHACITRAYFLQTYLIGLLSLLCKHLPPWTC